MSNGPSDTSAGWHPDPFEGAPPNQQRYWDGSQWTGHLHQPMAVPPPPDRPGDTPSPPASADSTAPAAPAAPASTTPRPSFAREPAAPGLGQQASRVGFGPRLGAVLIDAVVLVAAQFLVGGALGLVVGLAGGTRAWVEALGGLAGIAISVAYWIVLHARLRQTVGKRVVGAVVVDARTLEGISHPRALGRYLAEFLSGLPLGLGYLWVLWDHERQGWHDKLASTLVVRKAELAA